MVAVKCKWAFLVIFIIFIYKIPLVKTQDIKIWRKDSDFLNPENWKNGRVPCANDRIIFPIYPILTQIPSSSLFREMVLPYEGAVLFPENASIELTDGAHKGGCVGQDAFFRDTADFYHDPTNWNISSDRAFPRIPNRQNAAVPHAYHLPCFKDTAKFPDKTFQAHVIHPRTKVAFVDIGGVSYSHNQLKELSESYIGSLMFPPPHELRITQSRCTDETGCICGNDGPDMKPTVCINVTPYCPELECSDPIIPVGSCCPICGAQLMMKYRQGFEMDFFMEFYKKIFKAAEFQGVESYTTKTYRGDIQSTFVDGKQRRGTANKIASLIYQILAADIKGRNVRNIRSVKLFKSEKWIAGTSTYDEIASTKSMSSGAVAAIVIIMIIGVGLGAAFYVYKKRRIPGFNFARFDLHSEKIELELGTTPHEELQPGEIPITAVSEEEKDKGFDNPVYGTTVEEVYSAVEESHEAKDFVENPMFMIFEDSTIRENETD